MHRTIYLAGGCFWGVEKYIDQFDGVLATTVGYANGRIASGWDYGKRFGHAGCAQYG